MMDRSAPSLAEWFERLLPLSAAERVQQSQQLPAEIADRLNALLAADDIGDGVIDAALRPALGVAPAADLRGQRIGAWRILSELGSGGMGTVLLAEREQAGFTQQAAIKLIRGFPSQDGMRRLRQERQILASLEHPDIARLIDGGETDAGQPYLVVEYVRGQTLADHARAERPDREQCIRLIERIGQAVQYAHQHLIIHRDLKPGNVMITADGGIKLLDFGVAKLLDEQGDSLASTRVFTPGYASPEQRAGQPVGTTSDVYSLGMMLKELLATHARDADLNGIVDKATAEVPGQRYATMAAFVDDLERYRLGLPVAATPDTDWYRARKFLARHRWASALTALALLVIAVLGWRLIDALATARQQRDLADAERRSAETHLARSREVVAFFADMFAGVAPEHALGQKLAPAELLARAEQQLRTRPPADADLRRDLSAALGSLYQRLGDGGNARRLLELGSRGVRPANREEALELADRHSTLALVLFDLGELDAVRTEIEAAAALRQRFAADSPSAQLQSELELARWWIGQHRQAEGAATLERARAWLSGDDAQVAQRFEFLLLSAHLALDQGRGEAAKTAVEAALDLHAKHPELDRTRLIELERNLARAQQLLGNLAAADAAFARAIAAQATWIGDRGTRAMALHNDHAILLTTMGRYAEASMAYQHAARLFAESGGPSPEQDPRHLNNLCDLAIARGDYARARDWCAQSATLLATRAEDDAERLTVEGNWARARAFGGEPLPALAALDGVRERYAKALGPDSFPVALQDLRTSRIALMAGQPARALADAERAWQQMSAQFPTAHPWRVRALRALAMASTGEARPRWLSQAQQEAAQVLAAEHPLRAQLALDSAEILLQAGDRQAAVEALAPALTVLRACCVVTEVDRARADMLARQLGISAR